MNAFDVVLLVAVGLVAALGLIAHAFLNPRDGSNPFQ